MLLGMTCCTLTYANQLSAEQQSQIAATCRTYLNKYSIDTSKIPTKDTKKISQALSSCSLYGSCQGSLSDIPECAHKLNKLKLAVSLASIPTTTPIKTHPTTKDAAQKSSAEQLITRSKEITHATKAKDLLPPSRKLIQPIKKQSAKTPIEEKQSKKTQKKPAEQINWF